MTLFTSFFFFFFNDTATTEIYTLSLHDALPILSDILITSYEDNLYSRKVIESNGGKLEKIIFDEKSKKNICRYWVNIISQIV